MSLFLYIKYRLDLDLDLDLLNLLYKNAYPNF